jgi:hypothetical protein
MDQTPQKAKQPMRAAGHLEAVIVAWEGAATAAIQPLIVAECGLSRARALFAVAGLPAVADAPSAAPELSNKSTAHLRVIKESSRFITRRQTC